jgi:hypothetical protein
MGLAVLAGGLSFVGAADATELITDGSFENTTPSNSPIVNVGGAQAPGMGGGWSTFSTYLYSTLYTLPGPAGSGSQFLRPFAPGSAGIPQSSQTVTQFVSLTATTTLTPSRIDDGAGRFTVSAWFSSYRVQGDYSDLTLEFLDNLNNVLGSPVALGGSDFVVSLPNGTNANYPDAKDWGPDMDRGTIPAGARAARVRIASTAVTLLPDGYVDLVSLDVVDAAEATPILGSANPPESSVGAGPVVDISVTLQDRFTAVNTNSIQFFLDGNLVSPSIQKVETNTIIQYAAGLLPALSQHTYKIVFGDDGTPVTIQTNEVRFTVADYLALPMALRSQPGSEDTSKPGFNVSVYQVDTLLQTQPPIVQINLPASMSFSEAVLAGMAGPNDANLAGAATGNTYEVPSVINWITLFGATANFPNDELFPGIPGTFGSERSFVHEVRTFMRFPTSGFYQMGINNEDHFRLTAATSGIQTLQLVSPTNLTIPSVAIATNLTQLHFGGSLPLTPLTAPVVYATPSGNPDDACLIGTNTSLAGNIVLVDRGLTNCDSAFKAEQAQLAGAVAVLQTTPDDAGYPFRFSDTNANVRIPVLVIAEKYGAALLKSYLTNGIPVTATIRGDDNFRLVEWDGPKASGAEDLTVGFAVLAAGVYPMRLVAGQGEGNANLEWFSINPDGTRILVNDTSNPDALRTFRARTFLEQPVLDALTLAGGSVTISWTGNGALQEAISVTGSWTNSPNQNNPQTVPATSGYKFYRIQQ